MHGADRPTPRNGHTPAVYLAGAIEYAEDAGVGWRTDLTRWIAEHLGHEVFDPSRHDFQQLDAEEQAAFRVWKATADPRFHGAIRRIIDFDLHLVVNRADYIVCRWCAGTSRGGGAHGELTVAYLNRIPVYLLLETPREETSSWILGCADRVFDDWDAMRAFLLERYGRG